ncbi:hypothetical protein E0I56_022860 [Escherichia coli]|nr:hypothetical protein [Escherichia coli]
MMIRGMPTGQRANPKYQYLERVLNAVRDGLKQTKRTTSEVYILLINVDVGNKYHPGIRITHGFAALDIDGMDTLIDTRHYCDTATASPAKAKMAALIENWTPPDGGAMGMIEIGMKKMKRAISAISYVNATDSG